MLPLTFNGGKPQSYKNAYLIIFPGHVCTQAVHIYLFENVLGTLYFIIYIHNYMLVMVEIIQNKGVHTYV